jgi:hypothetical protein
MPYKVVIPTDRQLILVDVFEWLESHNLYHGEDWEYNGPDYFKDDWDYKFNFKRIEDASFFSLRWS